MVESDLLLPAVVKSVVDNTRKWKICVHSIGREEDSGVDDEWILSCRKRRTQAIDTCPTLPFALPGGPPTLDTLILM